MEVQKLKKRMPDAKAAKHDDDHRCRYRHKCRYRRRSRRSGCQMQKQQSTMMIINVDTDTDAEAAKDDDDHRCRYRYRCKYRCRCNADTDAKSIQINGFSVLFSFLCRSE
jgi:hypothetical protein